MLIVKNIENAIKEAKVSKIRLCEMCQIARTTLDSILNGADTRISTLEAIASALNKPISYFFDESSIIAKGDYSPSPDSGDIPMSVGVHVLTERIKGLEALIKEKDERIKEKDERIRDKDERINDLLRVLNMK